VSELNQFRARGSLVDALSSALDRGSHGLMNVPGLLKRILADEAWREFETIRGEHVTYDTFTDFVATRPSKGLGSSMELVARMIGTRDAELLRLLREANKHGSGKRIDGDSQARSGGSDSDYLAQRLKQSAPEEYAAVLRGERTINAAAIRAGIRPRRVVIRLDNAESAAETLRNHMTPAQIKELLKLLGNSS
jgi:hypothetical protein